MQISTNHTGHSCANTRILPSGNATSSADSYSSGPSSLSLNGKSSHPEDLNDAPTRLTSPSPLNNNFPISGLADTTTSPELPQCICIISPCSSSMSVTGPNVMSDSRSRHSFSLRNATSQEIAFILFAHIDGIKKAEWLNACSHTFSNLTQKYNQVNSGCSRC